MARPGGVRMVYVLLDGVGDLPSPDLGGKTPLEAARTPAMDSMARGGALGDAITVGRGIAPESDIAVFNMLGYTFGPEYPGRGVVEAIGAGVDFADGDLALRGNFATLGEGLAIADRRAGRNVRREDAEGIAREIEAGARLSDPRARATIVPTVGHRVSVRIRAGGEALLPDITNTDPAYERVGGMGVAREAGGQMRVAESAPLTDEAGARLAARLVNDLDRESRRIMAASGINARRRERGEPELGCILLRDAGCARPSVRPIGDVHSLSFACIVEMPVEVGIAQVLGMRAYEGGAPTDYAKKASVAADALSEHNVVYVHLKGPDEFGHDGDARGKARSIEEIDSGFFAPLLERVGGSATVAVSADHSTPCVTRGHSDDPVPVMVSGPAVRPDSTSRMTEAEARRGSIGRLAGHEVLRAALSMAGSKTA
ncbi:MAG: alkaline phosphatase family protein [Thaumarchaeota archaeon]|nr:alkaline phosphatase family protein [Nitrososphaerota archaeon]